MESGPAKFYLSIVGVLALIFGAVALTVSVRAGLASAGVMAGLFLLFHLWGGKEIESANKKFLLAIVWIFTFIFLVVALIVSVTAALVTVGVLVTIAVSAVLYVMRKFQQLGKSLTSALTLDIRLEPRRGRNSRNREGVEALAGELAALGFVPAGFYKIADQDMFVEGWTRPDLKLYAMITECESYAPYADISAFYADGGSFCVSASEVPPMFERPVNMIDLRFPGAGPAELLNIIMQRRPPDGLLDTPAKKFKETVEEEISSLREFLARQGDDEEDEGEFYSTRLEDGKPQG